MPTFEWIGKDKVINHHQELPLRVLERRYSYDETGQHAEMIQFHTLKNAANPPFLGGFFISNTVWYGQNGGYSSVVLAFQGCLVTIEKLSLRLYLRSADSLYWAY